MVPDSLVLCTEQMQASLKTLPGWHLGRHPLQRHLAPRSGLCQERRLRHQRSRPPLTSRIRELHHQHRSPLPQLWPSHRATCEPDVASSGSRCQATFHSVAAAPGRTCPQRINIFVQPVRRPHSGCKALELGLGLYHFRLGTPPLRAALQHRFRFRILLLPKGTRCSCAATSWTTLGTSGGVLLQPPLAHVFYEAAPLPGSRPAPADRKNRPPKQTRPQRGRQVPSQRYPHHSGGLRRPHLRLERLHSNNGHMDFPTTQLHSSLHFQ